MATETGVKEAPGVLNVWGDWGVTRYRVDLDRPGILYAYEPYHKMIWRVLMNRKLTFRRVRRIE